MSDRPRRKHAAWFAPVVLGLLLVMGCSPRDEEASTPADAGEQAAAPVDVRLEVVDRAGLDRVLQSHRGKVVLVDFWASWCGPCVQQFPHTVEMSHRHGGDGLAVVSVCMDEPENRDNVLAFLRRQGADIENLLSGLGGGPAAMEAFEIEGGALPYYKVFDRKGELRTTFSLDPMAAEQFTPEDIESAVAELLDE